MRHVIIQVDTARAQREMMSSELKVAFKKTRELDSDESAIRHMNRTKGYTDPKAVALMTALREVLFPMIQKAIDVIKSNTADAGGPANPAAQSPFQTSSLAVFSHAVYQKAGLSPDGNAGFN